MNAAIKPIEPVKPDAVEEALKAVKAKLNPADVPSIRKCCDWLERWRHCDAPACKRARACTGDAAQCFGRFYFACPEYLLVWVHAGIIAIEEGYTARVATDWADGALLANLKASNGLPPHDIAAPKRPVQVISALSPRSAARRASPCAAPPATS
jgi:hypothetical protein